MSKPPKDVQDILNEKLLKDPQSEGHHYLVVVPKGWELTGMIREPKEAEHFLQIDGTVKQVPAGMTIMSRHPIVERTVQHFPIRDKGVDMVVDLPDEFLYKGYRLAMVGEYIDTGSGASVEMITQFSEDDIGETWTRKFYTIYGQHRHGTHRALMDFDDEDDAIAHFDFLAMTLQHAVNRRNRTL